MSLEAPPPCAVLILIPLNLAGLWEAVIMIPQTFLKPTTPKLKAGVGKDVSDRYDLMPLAAKTSAKASAYSAERKRLSKPMEAAFSKNCGLSLLTQSATAWATMRTFSKVKV